MGLVECILQVRNAGLHSAALFLDLPKVFGTLNHTVLLQKLERYSIHGICNGWFKDYWTDTTLGAKINTSSNKIVKSSKYNITYGTAKGSCLGPLLFILFCNDIYLLPTFSNIILFADDTLFNSNSNINV